MKTLNCFRAMLTSLFCVNFALAATAPVSSFKDSFEGQKPYPFWATHQQSGTVTLSREHAYSGSQSLKLASTPGGSRHVAVSRALEVRTKGEVSVAFFDSIPGQTAFSAKLHVSDSTDPDVEVAVGVRESESQCYVAEFRGVGSGICPASGQGLIGAVRRSLGWHILAVHFGQSSISILIDGETIRSIPGEFAFDTVKIVMSGLSWDPDAAAYFDDFTLVPVSVSDAADSPIPLTTTSHTNNQIGQEIAQVGGTSGSGRLLPRAAAPAVAAVAPSGTSYVTVGRKYTGSVDLACPSGYVAVVATCNQGVNTVIHDRSVPPVVGAWVTYLTPNASAATGVHCDLGSPYSSSTAFLRCVK